MSSIYNYGAYDLTVSGFGGIWPKWAAWDGHRKMTRPVRLSFWRGTGRAVSSSSCPGSSLAGALALNRRFGASETKAGDRKVPFFASVFGPELILPLESKGCPSPDASY